MKKSITEELRDYFKKTPNEKILKDWEKTKDCDKIGITVDEFKKEMVNYK